MAITLTEKQHSTSRNTSSVAARAWACGLAFARPGAQPAYKLEYVDGFAPEDQVFESHGVKVIVDPKSLTYIDGTEPTSHAKA